MSSLIPEEILRRIREKMAEAKGLTTPKSYRPPVASDFAPGVQILAFDQTLSNCGWSLINTEDDRIQVADSGTIRPPAMPPSVKGFEVTFTKAIMIGRDLRDLVRRLHGQYEQVVLELPSVVGYRTESSLVAAVTICLALDEAGENFPTFVSRQSAAARLCGSPSASKKVSSDVVDAVVDEHPTGTGQWTEHVRDSVLVGLRALYLEDV
jgi:Holliday junction resolvasome RuvABC endonuclease subunit